MYIITNSDVKILPDNYTASSSCDIFAHMANTHCTDSIAVVYTRGDILEADTYNAVMGLSRS